MTEKYQEDEQSGTPRIKTTKVVYPQVYSYTLPDLTANYGSQKIGYTERKDVDVRIHEQTHTAAFQLEANKLWSAPAFFTNSQQDFNDKTFHAFLTKSSIKNMAGLGTEWFYFNGTPERSKQLFDTFRSQGFAALQSNGDKIPYTLRTEQELAVEEATNYFNSHENGEFLWNAKPRFGKTLASYDLAKRLDAKKVLIVTNRPAIANSWFDDFEMFIDGYYFISETSSLDGRRAITRQQYISTGDNQPQITFLSLQDLKGSKYFGGGHDKLKWVADLEWDLLVIDEAHEGVDTDRTDAAFDIVNRKNTLHLSGTPFKALANNKFDQEAIFNWTYLDEQKIKQAELEENETGDHTDLPNLKLYTYRISQMIADEVNEGIEIDDENRDFAFDLNEFFATKNQKFVHEDDVKTFLKNLTTNTKYPFSSPELRDQLRHTFWYVGNRVDSVKALEQLLKTDEIFKGYKVVVAAGDGKSFDEEAGDFKGNEKSFDKVKKAIAENPKTITLTCGQLTTGVTIKEWSAVLMLTDIKTPTSYMQAAFRAQNPYKFFEDNELKVKESAYLFDFAPTRVLEIYDQFANALNPKAVNGEITESERKQNIKELLNYFPVISEDVDGRMVELDAEKVLTFPNALAATEIVKARFMTNLLFNDNIKNVFHFPKEIEDILDKMPVEKNKRAEVAKKELDLDDARKVEQGKQTKINENNNVILGEKIYRTNIERVVDNALDTETPGETLETLPEKVAELVEPVIAKYKEIYKATNAEIDELRKDNKEKIKLAVAEYENTEFKDAAVLKENLAKIIEHDFVEAKVDQQETAVVDNVQKTKEDEVRDHLRAFTRTIPMFIMANSSRETITIDNFDDDISEEDFTDLTNITKAEFHMLRDGFEYEQDGERKTFGGVFDHYKFNASIAEFVSEKQKRANYFTTDDDIFELIPNQKNNQIFTPRKVVKMMIDGLEKESPELFQRTDSTFIDLYMKSGMYITEIVKKLFTNTRSHYDSDQDCLKHILENQVYGLAPTGILYGITNSYIFGFDNSHQIDTKNFKMHDLLPEAKDNTAHAMLVRLYNGGNMMRFDAVVGNPPYDNGSGQQIYTDFYLSARQVANNVSMIFPIGWQSPKTANNLGKLNNKDIKEDSQIVKIDNIQYAFPKIAGAEWTNVILWRRGYDNGLDGKQRILTNGENPKIEQLVWNKDDIQKPDKIVKLAAIVMAHSDFEPVQGITSSRKPYGLDTDFMKDPLKYGLPKVQDLRLKDSDIELWTGGRGGRIIKYVPESYPFPKKTKALNKYKVLVAYAWGNWSEGAGLGGAYSDIIIAGPNVATTETWQESGIFNDFETAQKHAKYLMTKFSRALLYLNKNSQHSTTAWGAVPIQDYCESWWSESIANIDKKLMQKYNISEDVQSFVFENIQQKSESNIVNYRD
ncbi:MAG: DEAD/DEAH box helicase family protein [Candidatus Saccharimonadales bacterium]